MESEFNAVLHVCGVEFHVCELVGDEFVIRSDGIADLVRLVEYEGVRLYDMSDELIEGADA